MSTIQIRYQKTDQYKNLIFIAKSDVPDELETFKRLTNFHNTYKDKITTFLPMYATSSYATMRCKPNPNFQFQEGSVYQLDFAVRKKSHDEKEYVNIFINKSKLIRKSNVDAGELIEF